MSCRIIFLSGWAADSSAWNKTIASLGSNVSCQHISWRECLKPNDNALLTALEDAQEPMIVAGWSLGVLMTLSAAATRPDKVAAMILVAATARMTAEGSYPGADPRALSAMQARLGRSPKKVLANFAESCIAPQTDRVFIDDFVNSALEMPPEHLRAGLEYLRTKDVRSVLLKLSKLKMPALVVHGQNDKIIPVDSGRYLAQRLENAKFIELAGCGHALLDTASQQIAKAIGRFINNYVKVS